MNSLLLNCEDEHSFRTNDGKSIKNLKELSQYIDSIDDESFRNHVNEDRNDFSNWIRDVLKNKSLADKLSKTKDKNATQLLLLKSMLNVIKEISR